MGKRPNLATASRILVHLLINNWLRRESGVGREPWAGLGRVSRAGSRENYGVGGVAESHLSVSGRLRRRSQRAVPDVRQLPATSSRWRGSGDLDCRKKLCDDEVRSVYCQCGTALACRHAPPPWVPH